MDMNKWIFMWVSLMIISLIIYMIITSITNANITITYEIIMDNNTIEVAKYMSQAMNYTTI